MLWDFETTMLGDFVILGIQCKFWKNNIYRSTVSLWEATRKKTLTMILSWRRSWMFFDVFYALTHIFFPSLFYIQILFIHSFSNYGCTCVAGSFSWISIKYCCVWKYWVTHIFPNIQKHNVKMNWFSIKDPKNVKIWLWKDEPFQFW